MAERERVIVALPDPREGAAVADWLSQEGLDPIPVCTTRAAVGEMLARPFSLLVTDFEFAYRDGLYTRARARHPLTPAVVIGEADTVPPTEAASAQTICLARPIEQAMLLCYVTMALLEGRPMQRSPRKAVQGVDVFVNGVPARILDVSNEGVRLEVPDSRTQALPAYFNVRVPQLGVSVTAQRVWTQPSPRGSMLYCGGVLAQNRVEVEQAWRSFVDTLSAA